MIEALLGTKFAGYIAGAWGVSALGLLTLAVWVGVTHAARRRDMARLERAGQRRAARD